MMNKTLSALIYRNVKLFFKDKGLLFSSLITPIILLVLYTTFLGNIYRDSFVSSVPEGVPLPARVLDGVVACQLISSLLAVSCVTVAFCSNMLMVQDKVNGIDADFAVSPVRASSLALGYYIATLISTLAVNLVAAGAGFIYIAVMGWYLSVSDVLLTLLDVLLLTMFGTALSTLINFFLTSQGQISAVGTIVSAGYGFICGAYMPISQFGEGLQKVISFLPGTYATALIRRHLMSGPIDAFGDSGFPAEVLEGYLDAVDCNIYFFGEKVGIGAMYAVLCGSTALLILACVLVFNLRGKKAK